MEFAHRQSGNGLWLMTPTKRSSALVAKSMTALEHRQTQTVAPQTEPGRTDNLSRAVFRSILFEGSEGANVPTREAPAFFRDLNLDQVVDAITANTKEYNLKPFFYHRLTDLGAIGYRQEVMRDLEDEALFQTIRSFSATMRRMRQDCAVAEKASYEYEKEAWLLDAADMHCEAVQQLLHGLNDVTPTARGLAAFQSYLEKYVASDRFQTLRSETQSLKAQLKAIKYCLLILGNSVTVRHYDAEIDYGTTVEEIFAKFENSEAKEDRAQSLAPSGLNQVEAMILDRVAQLYPDVFLALDAFCAKNKSYAERVLVDFDREIQFYIAWREYVEPFKRSGLHFCYPELSVTSKEVSNQDGFDLALAAKLLSEGATVVCNDFSLGGSERIFVVTGPNQGGKTTFARTFGQLHHLASLGLPVAGTRAQLYLADQLFTHFEREEDITTLRGKLQDDLFSIHEILNQATAKSIIILNEIFSSTTTNDALCLSERILETLSQLDLLAVCVTFIDELVSPNEKTVSVVAGIVRENPTLRTYRIERMPANGLAYAAALAAKYGLTFERIRERIKQ